MSLTGKELLLVESPQLLDNFLYLIRHKYRAIPTGYPVLPEIDVVKKHQAALIHLTKEKRDVDRDLEIILSAYRAGMGIIVAVSLLSREDMELNSRLVNLGIKTIEKGTELGWFYDALSYLNEQV